MKKVLFCASTLSHICNFHLPYIKAFHESGYEVWVAADKVGTVPYADKVVAFPFTKRIFCLRNVTCVRQLRKLLAKERFDKVSANTALAGFFIRLAILLMPRNLRPQGYYIAHGFLFHQNDGLKKWLYLLPEMLCARVTDVLMVMNREDFEIATKYRLYKGKLCFINGIGIDLSRFAHLPPLQRQAGRQALGFSDSDFLFIYAAEFSKRKNQEMLIRAFCKASPAIPQAHLLLAGSGDLYEKCGTLADKLQMRDKIHFLGYVNDMRNVFPLCDAAVSPSKSEGIPFHVMEAMACGLPVLLSDVKGHRDLVENKHEFLFTTEQELVDKILELTLRPCQPLDWSFMLEKYSIEEIAPKVMEQYNHDLYT